MDTLGERFAHAVAARDEPGLRALLAPDVELSGLTPGRTWGAHDPDGVVEVVLGHWFEESDRITAARVERGDPVGDTGRVGYRFELTNDAGEQVVEQQAYWTERDGVIAALRVVCSGFRPAD